MTVFCYTFIAVYGSAGIFSKSVKVCQVVERSLLPCIYGPPCTVWLQALAELKWIDTTLSTQRIRIEVSEAQWRIQTR